MTNFTQTIIKFIEKYGVYNHYCCALQRASVEGSPTAQPLRTGCPYAPGRPRPDSQAPPAPTPLFSQRKPSRESPASVRVFRNTTCTPTAPPPQQNSHICAHAPGQAVKLTNSTGCSNLTGTGFPYPQSTPIAPTRRLPLPTHLSPPLPAQNSHICTHARTRSSGQTNKQQRLLYTPGRPRLGSQVQAAPNLLAGQGRVHRRGCAPVATTSTRQRRTIASAHRAHRSGGQTQKHRLPLRFWPAKAGSQAQATSTRVGHPHPHTRTGCPNAPCPSTCTGTGFCCLSAPMFLPAHIICNHITCRTLDVTTFVRNPFL
jgi:hypothetical protein